MPYLKLWHGRRSLDEQLNAWGEDGPVFGPFRFFHMTYDCEIKFGDDDHELSVIAGLVFYDGAYYGDWSFCDELDSDMQLRLVPFDPAKAVCADRPPENLQADISPDSTLCSMKGGDVVDSNAAWLELMDAFRGLDWDRVRDLADGLLQWMQRGGYPPETSIRNSTNGLVADSQATLGSEWNRTVADAACRYARYLAIQVLRDQNGIPHSVPFTLVCCQCDADGPADFSKAVEAGWRHIRFVPQYLGSNFIGDCPNCMELCEEIRGDS